MTPHSSLQHEFSRGLLNPDAAVPVGVIDPKGKSAPKRYSVYRNNVTMSLIEALLAGFPVVAALVGEAFFRNIARDFARAHPPQSPVMAEYGRGFPEFVSNYPAAQTLVFLADVARLEWAWLEGFHAVDAPVLGPEALAGIAPDLLGALVLEPHSAARIVASHFSVADIWEAGRAGIALAGLDIGRAQTALVVRPAYDVSVHPLSAAGGVFVTKLMDQQTLESAAEAAIATNAQFDTGQALARLLTAGVFGGVAGAGENEK